MNWAQTINTIIFVFGTAFSVFGSIHLANLQKQKMPNHTRLALKQFSRIAVQQVEKQNKTLSGSAKKQLALAAVSKLFQAFELPLPSSEAIDIAVESAAFLLPKDNNSPSS